MHFSLLGVALTTAFWVVGGSGHTSFSTDKFTGILDAKSGVLRSLTEKSSDFNFSPTDVFDKRNGNGNYHTGDVTLRYRVGESGAWTGVNTAADRSTIPQNTSSAGINSSRVYKSDDLTVTREWVDVDGDLALNVTLTNTNTEAIELGSFGFPIEWNTIFTERSAIETREKCVFVDPYIGLHGGYLQVTRLMGVGPHLVITPLGETKFEAWRFLPERGGEPLWYQSQVFEGNYEWQVFSRAWTEDEWSGVDPWNEGSKGVVKAGESVSFGLRFSLAESVEGIEGVVAEKGLPVAVGVPGYVVPRDLEAKLFVNTSLGVESVKVEPEGALVVEAVEDVQGWKAFTVAAGEGAFGRVRVVITYTDGRTHSLHYYVTDSGPEALSKLGDFLTTTQWYNDTSDPFKRAPSIITYDHEAGAPVLQDNRVWIAGLMDEGGAGAFVTAAMKQLVQPVADEIAKLELFINETLWSRLQITSGDRKYGVRKSLFFYDTEAMPDFSYNGDIAWGGAWNKEGADLLDRAYNYVHVSCLYWVLYRVGRADSSLLEKQAKEWYLTQAFETVRFVYGQDANGNRNTWYGDLGLMGESVWKLLLDDLKLENYTEEATTLEDMMKSRTEEWSKMEDPFGSEQAWDCTGQEGVYQWSKYFGFDDISKKTVESIRGFMPTVAHWGWNGNARRYWDFGTAGKIGRIERQIHHYGSSLNALPILDNYHSSSDPTSASSFYDLRIGYGGNQGPLSNIGSDGFGHMSFHSFPDTLSWDPYSGDYGSGFLGHILGAASYLVQHPVFGWLSFGGNIVSSDGEVVFNPRDSVRQRVFLAPVGLFVSVSAGVLSEVRLDAEGKKVTVEVDGDVSALVKYSVTAGVVDGEVKLTGGVSEGKYGDEVDFKGGKGALVFEW